MGEHDGHRERLRARLDREGIDHFAPHEVLELILFYSVPRANTNPIAHRLMERFGSLSGVLEAPPAELLKVPGVGPASAALLSSIPLFARRYLQDKNGMGVVLDTTQKLGKYILPRFVGLNNEHLYMICLDKKRKLLNCSLLSEGGLGQVAVDLRSIVETALRCSASCVVLAHNHTQGFAVPSRDDIQMTRQVAKALQMVSVELIDHIVISREEFVSMASTRGMWMEGSL